MLNSFTIFVVEKSEDSDLIQPYQNLMERNEIEPEIRHPEEIKALRNIKLVQLQSIKDILQSDIFKRKIDSNQNSMIEKSKKSTEIEKPAKSEEKSKVHKTSEKEEPNVHRRRSSQTPKEPKEVKYDAVCSLQLVETVPVALKSGGHAKRMKVEHMSIFDVSFFLILFFSISFYSTGCLFQSVLFQQNGSFHNF